MPKAVVLLTIVFIGIFSQPVFSFPVYPPADTSRMACQQKATQILDEVMAILQKNYYKKEAVQWDNLITEAKGKINNAASCSEANEVIDWCFQQLQETHSYLVSPTRSAIYNNDISRLASTPPLSQLVGEIRGELLEGNIGYITVPWISTTDPAICTRIADSLQNLIARIDQQEVSKWIIDLRKNTGGNCWPMLAGVGPLLGNGVCGYFISEEERVAISYRDGAAYHGRHPRCSVSKAYTPRLGNKWIAVLTGPKTSSSGEIVALAFKQMNQVYFYGEPTAGFTTANATYTLSDNSMLVVTVCREADRTGAIQYGKIIPHDVITPTTAADDVVKKKAVMWLQSISDAAVILPGSN